MAKSDQTPHPNSPAGGGGPGGFRNPALLGPDGNSWPVNSGSSEASILNVAIPAGSAGHPGWSADPPPSANPVMKVFAAKTWTDLQDYAEKILGGASFDLGVCYGMTENLVSGVASMLGLLKTFVLEGVYERVKQPPSGWAFGAWPQYVAAIVWERLVGDAELKKAHDQCVAMLAEVNKIIDDPTKFFKLVGKKYAQEYAAKWANLKELLAQHTLVGDFQAGRITGQVMLDVIMIVLTVWGVAETVAKLAAEIPELLDVVKGLQGAKEAIQVEKASAAAAGVGEESEIVSVARESAPAVEAPAAAIRDPIPHSQTAYEYYMQKVETLDVSTKQNEAVFYSGKGNRSLAEGFAQENGKVTLEQTPGGNYLDNQKLFDKTSPLTPDEAVQVWSRLSQRYAQGASGSCTAFVDGARPNGIFNAVEYPALTGNPNVTNVITGGK